MIRIRFPVAVWLAALALAAVTSLPHAIGWWRTPDDMLYSGGPALPTGLQWDYNSRMGMLAQGARQEWALHLLFTPEPHTGMALVQGYYVGTGALAGLAGLGMPLAFHLSRFIMTTVMVLALWAFAERFFARVSERWLCLLMATVASGWSWVLLLVAPGMTQDVSPIEFWLIDAFNLIGALYVPHFAASVALQVAVLLVFEAWVDRGGVARLLWLTLFLAIESITQPYGIVLFGSLIGLLALYHVFVSRKLAWKRMLFLALPAMVYAGLVLYQYFAMKSDPVWSSFVEQNQTRSPAVIYYVFGYAPFLIPMAVGWAGLRVTQRESRWLMVWLWVGLVAVLVYAPFMTQRRYLLGVQTPLAVLATQAWLYGILPHLREPRRHLVTIAYVGFAAIASLLMIIANVSAIASADVRDDLYYTADEQLGFEWLRLHTPPDTVVLTVATHDHYGSGGRVMAQTGRYVFVGHFIETAHFAQKVEQIRRFYDPAVSNVWRRRLLEEYDVEYIWYDRYAQQLGEWNPASWPYLESVFSSDTVTIFRRKE